MSKKSLFKKKNNIENNASGYSFEEEGSNDRRKIPLLLSKDKKDNTDSNQIFKSTTEKDIIAPTVVKEIGKKDVTIDGVANDYYVEVGATSNFTRYFRSFFATIFAENTHFGMINDLIMGGFGDADCDISIHTSVSDKDKVRRALVRKIEGLRSDYDMANRNTKKREIAHELNVFEAQEERLRRGQENVYNVGIQVTVSGEEIQPVKKYCNVMVKRMMNHGFHLRAADTKQLHALTALTPCDNVKKDFAYAIKPLETSNLADLFPYGHGSISHPNGIPIGEDSFGKIIQFHPRYPKMQNYNSLTFGQSGSGKSMKEKMLRARNLSFGISTTIIEYDRDKEHKKWISQLGFKYIEFNAMNSEYTLNVFPVPTIQTIQETGNMVADIDDAVNTVAAVIYKMIRQITEQSITGTKKIRIKEAIQDCYFDKGIGYEPESIFELSNVLDDGTYSMKKVNKRMPQLCDLYEHMRANKFNGELKEESEIIKAFTKAGNIKGQSIFDCQTTVDFENELLVGMCVADLDEIMKPLGLYLATTNSWSAYERLPKNIAKDIVIEEAQNMMVESDEADWLEQRWRTSRRRNIGMHAITQGFEVFLRAQQGLGILKNSSVKFLMKQDAMDIEAVEKKFNLPDGVKTRLLGFDKGECIFIVENDMTQMRTKPMPYEYQLFSTNPNE
jgi:hypothetical protein